MWRHPSNWLGTSPRTPCAIASVSSLWLVARFARIAQVGVGTRLICTYCNGVLMMSRTYAHVCSFSHLQQIPLYRNKHKIRHYCGSRHWRHMVREKHCTHWYPWIENVDINKISYSNTRFLLPSNLIKGQSNYHVSLIQPLWNSSDLNSLYAVFSKTEIRVDIVLEVDIAVIPSGNAVLH